MAIRKDTIDLIYRAIGLTDKKFKDISICELGNQNIRHIENLDYPHKTVQFPEYSKRYFERLGIGKVTSIDWNGKDGALKCDLSKPLKIERGFDIITNYGTSEHISNQYDVFNNIHNLIGFDSFMVHCLPGKSNVWKRHGYFYYSTEFFEHLANAMEYEIVINEVRRIKSCICVLLIKKYHSQFMNREKFNLLFSTHTELNEKGKKKWKL